MHRRLLYPWHFRQLWQWLERYWYVDCYLRSIQRKYLRNPKRASIHYIVDKREPCTEVRISCEHWLATSLSQRVLEHWFLFPNRIKLSTVGSESKCVRASILWISECLACSNNEMDGRFVASSVYSKLTWNSSALVLATCGKAVNFRPRATPKKSPGEPRKEFCKVERIWLLPE